MTKNPFTIEAFCDWLGSKPPDEEYDYRSGGGCCIAQYLKSLGMHVVHVGPAYGQPVKYIYADSDFKVKEKTLPAEFGTIAIGNVSRLPRSKWDDEWRFGEAFKRAQKVKESI